MFIDELLELVGQDITIYDLDEKIDELYERYFEPINLDEDNRTYKCNNGYFIKVKYIFDKNKNKSNDINISSIVNITDIEAY